MFAVAGCGNCHTDAKHGGALLAGGRALKTGFGVFYTPNISSDPHHGIGAWSDRDFVRALRQGISPAGRPYYPAFPYTAYTLMTDSDMLAIKAYIMSLPPQPATDRPHVLRFPYDQRWLLPLWQVLFLRQGPLQSNPERTDAWNRGAYLVRAVGHCAECHSPRNFLGALDGDRHFAGVIRGPAGFSAPDITPDPAALGSWSETAIARFLKDGMMPDGDLAGGEMAVMIKGTAQLDDADRHAIAIFLKDVPPFPPPKPDAP